MEFAISLVIRRSELNRFLLSPNQLLVKNKLFGWTHETVYEYDENGNPNPQPWPVYEP